MSGSLSSAKGLLSLLLETDSAVIHFALTRINAVVDEFWFEMPSQLPLVEEISESANLPSMTRHLAALLASRTYFHLGAFDDSVQFALNAGPVFNEFCAKRSDYADTILGRCIDIYVNNREAMFAKKKNDVAAAAADEDGAAAEAEEAQPTLSEFDASLEKTFESLAKAWVDGDSSFIHTQDLIGLALRARRVDILGQVLGKQIASTGSAEMIGFCLRAANDFIADIVFRTTVLRCLAGLYTSGLKDVDHFALIDCLLFLRDADGIAKLLIDLLDAKQTATAYQICFDLFDTANQDLLEEIMQKVRGATITPATADGEAQLVSAADKERNANLEAIISGKLTTNMYLRFLYSQCKADVHVLNQTKKALPPKMAVLGTATVMSSALMYCGTTIDAFLRDNMQWLGKATNWAKFAATASVGVIHKGHTDAAMDILKPYLPTSTGSSASPLMFQEAGAMYALGLIYSGIGRGNSETVTYLRDALRTYSGSENVIHGASLGLGLTAMGLRDPDIFDALFVCVNGCDAVAGEAAALGIGLVMMGSGDTKSVDMLLASARENDQKEKTIRGLCMGIAIMMIGKEGLCDALVDQLVADRDPWVRVGGCFTLGLAYAATNNTDAIARLLQVCVRDVADEVRRTAIMMIGFITLSDPARCVALTRVFADSYNPHIRYGVAMALGVAAAGSGHADAVDMLWGLKDDMSDFVRQGSHIALAMVLVQQSPATNEKAKEFRTLLTTKINDGKCDPCTKFGCIIATGVLDAGGRNCTIALHKNGHASNKAVVGVFVFMQHWYWFPYTLMLSLALQPTCIIGLNDKLQMPKYQLKSNAAPSKFAAPVSVLATRKEAKAAASKAAVLSTTVKEADAKKKRHQLHGGSEPTSPTQDAPSAMPTAAEAAAKDAGAKDAAAKEDKEDDFEVLENPARVTTTQLAGITHDMDDRYTPLKAVPGLGICLLTDRKPDEAAALVDVDLNDRRDEVQPPEPFAWP